MKSSVSLAAVLAICFAAPGLFASGGASSGDTGTAASSQFVIPGPQRSFLRMAGISQRVTPDEVLPLLSRNVFTEGYQGSSRPTEFLILLRRYVVQARELASLASENGMMLRVTGCNDAGPLLRILGYRVRPNCGTPGSTLLTDDPERAFLAIDSGFPLPALEQSLQGGKPFEYAFSSDPVPVIFAESDWTQLSKKNMSENSRDLLETILFDPSIARLYWAFSRLDGETSKALKESVGLSKLLPHAAVLDFYGRELCISHGTVVVPGGERAAGAWKELVGASPTSPATFVPKLLARDKGWLAAYFDVLSRTSHKQQGYFTDPKRLLFFYTGLRAPDPKASATRGSFRPAPWMLLLVTRLHLDDSGQPLVPGSLEEWNDIVFHGRDSLIQKWAKQSPPLRNADQLLKAMFALSRAPSDSTPLQAYVAISELEARRSPQSRLAPATVRLLARKFEDFSAQYRIFSEFPELDDQSITSFLQCAQGLHNIPQGDRGNAFGIFQANVSMWQILARQGEIPRMQLNESWQGVIKPFAGVRSATQVYDAGRASLLELFRSSTGKPEVSQDKIIDLLAGPAQSTAEGKEMHRESAARIRSVLDDQRLVSLDTLMVVGDALRDKERGKEPEEYMVSLAAQTREFQMPRPIFTTSEHEEWAAGIYNSHHADVQMKADLPKLLKSRNASAKQLEEGRGQLTSFLRDTLVGLNYAYYEPPGAQALHNNPLLVRSHDFAGDTVSGLKTLWQAPEMFGEGSPAGGGAHFVGSLADLPYSLSILEQDFISPSSVQALIWKEVTPELLASAILSRWWDVTPLELHAVALYQRTGEELLAASEKDEALRSQIMNILSERLLPQRSRQFEQDLEANRASRVLSEMMPADTFYLAAEFLEKHPERAGEIGTATQELQELSRQHPDEVNLTRLSHDFGIPHPAMAQNYGLELLNMLPMPPFAGEANRFLAESWDSPNLYWARLADERGYAPVMLNHLVPELTRMMVERIFATDFEDWPALLRAMHQAGDDFRAGRVEGTEVMSAGRP
ncbi:MAG TPA: hypothetical protein VJQ54_04730 [Candidatus Sulfotelmatobacter sp.]|nr:hypothetical protein [Candidatus Sulfotelmatobacter sp.]